VWILLKDPPTFYILILYLQKNVQGYFFHFVCCFSFYAFLGLLQHDSSPTIGWFQIQVFFSACVPTIVETISFRHHSLHVTSCFPNQVMVLLRENIDKNQEPFIIVNPEKKWRNVNAKN